MTVTTVFADASDGNIESSNATYATARSGGTLFASSGVGAEIRTGQNLTGGVYAVYECFLSFDTSSIADSDAISAVALSGFLKTDNSATDFTAEARISNWGATLTTADWVAGASLSALTRVATLASSGIGATEAYKTFTEEGSNFTANVDKTGTTYVLLCSDRHIANTAPTNNVPEQIDFYPADETGTTKDPKLVVTHTTGIGGSGDSVGILIG